MKRILFFVLLLLSTTYSARATHVAGEEIYYKNIGPNTYRVYAIFYGTCKGANYDYFYNPGFCKVYAIDSNSGPSYTSIPLTLTRYDDGLGDSVDVDPYCPRMTANGDNCTNPSGPQGYVRYSFSTTVTLPNTSSKWAFVFLSEFDNCGNFTGWNTFNNFTGSGNLNLFMYATLNNVAAENSSPVYNATSKFNLYCPVLSNIYTQASTDSDHDSVAYNFSQPYLYHNSNNCGDVPRPLTALGTYSYANPLPGTETLKTQTGELDFNTNGQSGSYLVSFTLSEYRNGVLVGTSQRQRIFIINSADCGIPAAGHIDSTTISGATFRGQDTLYACPGNSISFKVPVKDTSSDSIFVSFNDIISGSTVAVNNNNTPNPTITVDWNTSGFQYGVYTLTAYFNTKSCPLPSIGSQTYTIIIGDAGIITYGQLSQTDCIYKAAMHYIVQNGGAPYTITLLQGADTLKTYTEAANTATVPDSLAAGNYFIILKSQGLPCTSYTPMVITDDGTFPYKPTRGDSVAEYCLNGKDTALVAYLTHNAQYLNWYDESGATIPSYTVPSTKVPGTYTFTVNQAYKTCLSDRDTMTVIVDKDPCDYDPVIHNVITPNGDGKNDVWEIENLKFYPNTKVEVFDKLGDKVYEQNHYGAPWWDGGSLPSGVYYYVVDLGRPNLDTGVQKYTGYILIKR